MGVFIVKMMIEKIGGIVCFENFSVVGGVLVMIVWLCEKVEVGLIFC